MNKQVLRILEKNIFKNKLERTYFHNVEKKKGQEIVNILLQSNNQRRKKEREAGEGDFLHLTALRQQLLNFPCFLLLITKSLQQQCCSILNEQTYVLFVIVAR